MMTTTITRFIAIGAMLTCAGVVLAACIGDGSDPLKQDGGATADAGADSFTLFEAGGCDAATYNQQGCACNDPGVPRDCFQGVPGPKSACTMSGVQQCGADRTWGACTGGSMPVVEKCFDGIDNDCNGVVDQKCVCSEDLDLCKIADGGTLNPNAYNVVLDPPSPKANQPFDLIIVTTQPVGSPRSLAMQIKNCGCQNPGCQGQTESPCDSPGKNCGNWAAVRWRLTLPANTYTAQLTTNDPNGNPCTGASHALPEFTVTN